MPVPLNCTTIEPAPAVAKFTDQLAVRVPTISGANQTPKLQDMPGPIEPPGAQVVPLPATPAVPRINSFSVWLDASAVIGDEASWSATVPLLFMVMSCTALLVPVRVLPKVIAPGVTVIAMPGVGAGAGAGPGAGAGAGVPTI